MRPDTPLRDAKGVLIQVVTVTSGVLAPLPCDLESGGAKEKLPQIRERKDTKARAPLITVRRPHPRQTPTSLHRPSQRRHPRGEPASKKANEPSQVTMGKEGRFSQNLDYANRGEAAMGSRASNATNKIKAEVFAANPSHRRPSRGRGPPAPGGATDRQGKHTGTVRHPTRTESSMAGPRAGGTPGGSRRNPAALTLSPRLGRLFPASCGNRHAMSRLGFPPPKGSLMGPRLLPL
ncbi:LOW QUALITY PROTEIN: uncharacterized protein CSNK1G2-AS1-like [Sapajus apella]|uniref:LOW QUALITY PROTEIN: uncharacterized protein CSNK1G2-AS1-like n=1 Tax=Sapajus apella TaxID=9515 RepID=A0A6J3FRI4_SAPAP|nr:LOW QUALITY PROTEIN: uncharacterized protein CSNK1G2-AS1-like [Sapajus apella]